MEKTDSALVPKVDLVRQDTKKNSDDDSKVPSAQVDVQPCPAISSSVRNDCCDYASPANDCTAKTDSTLVNFVHQDTKKNSYDYSKVPSAQVDVKPCPAISSSVRTDCRGAAPLDPANDCTEKTNSTLADLDHQDTKGNADADTRVVSTKPDEQPCPAFSSVSTTDYSGNALPVMATDSTAKINSILASGIDKISQVSKRNGNNDIQVRSTKPRVQPCRAAMSLSGDCGGAASPILATDLTAREHCSWATIVDMIRRDPKGFAENILSAIVDVKPRPATCLSLTKDCSDSESHVPATDDFPAKTNCTLASKADMVHQVANRKGNGNIQVRSVNPDAIPGQAAITSSPVLAIDDAARKDCAWTTIVDVFRRDPKGFADKVRSAFVDIKPRPATCLALTKNCSGPVSPVPDTGFQTNTNCTLVFEGDKAHHVGKGFADKVLPANTDVKPRPATCLLLTKDCNGPTSRDVVSDFPTKTKCTLDSKSDMVHQVGKGNDDNPLSANVDVQSRPAASVSFTIGCGGAKSHVPVTDLMAKSDCNLASKGDTVSKDTEHDRNDEQVSSPSFDEMMDFLGLSFNADDDTAGSIDTLKNDGFCLQSEPNDTKALIEAETKIKMPPQKPKRRRSIRTGNSVTIVTGTSTPRNDGNTIRLLKSSTDSAPAPLSQSPLKESPLDQSLKDIDGRAYGDKTSTSVSMAAKNTHDDDEACSTMMSEEAPFSSIRDDEQQINTQSNIKGNRKRRFSLSSIKKRILSTFSIAERRRGPFAVRGI
ncbi:uncharacterized protein [Ptychodera flava]|uniref:uncharacterized protein n=1 Tax=Ptychodera flava TaxID=63121 RepID=UPI00396A7EB5